MKRRNDEKVAIDYIEQIEDAVMQHKRQTKSDPSLLPHKAIVQDWNHLYKRVESLTNSILSDLENKKQERLFLEKLSVLFLEQCEEPIRHLIRIRKTTESKHLNDIDFFLAEFRDRARRFNEENFPFT